MSREIRRVPLDFDAPIHKTWEAPEVPTGDGWQLWQAVSEGGPVTPVFPTAEELIKHLMEFGDREDRSRPWSRESAEAMIANGWMPSRMSLAALLADAADAFALMDQAEAAQP